MSSVTPSQGSSLCAQQYTLLEHVAQLYRKVENTANFGIPEDPEYSFNDNYSKQSQKCEMLKRQFKALLLHGKKSFSGPLKTARKFLKITADDMKSIPEELLNLKKIQEAANKVASKQFEGIAPLLLSLPQSTSCGALKYIGVLMDNHVPLALLQLEQILKEDLNAFKDDRFQGLIKTLPKFYVDNLKTPSSDIISKIRSFYLLSTVQKNGKKVREQDKHVQSTCPFPLASLPDDDPFETRDYSHASLCSRLFSVLERGTYLQRNVENTLLFGKIEPGITFKKLWEMHMATFNQLRREMMPISEYHKSQLSPFLQKAVDLFGAMKGQIDAIPTVNDQLQRIQSACNRVRRGCFEQIAPTLLSLPQTHSFAVLKHYGILIDKIIPLTLLKLVYLLSSDGCFKLVEFKKLLKILPEDMQKKLPAVYSKDSPNVPLFLLNIRGLDEFPLKEDIQSQKPENSALQSVAPSVPQPSLTQLDIPQKFAAGDVAGMNPLHLIPGFGKHYLKRSKVEDEGKRDQNECLQRPSDFQKGNAFQIVTMPAFIQKSVPKADIPNVTQ